MGQFLHQLLVLFAVFKSLCRAKEIEIKHYSLDYVLKRSASCLWNHLFLSKTAIMNSLVISVSTIVEKQNFFLSDDKILYDADCADASHCGDILNSLAPIRISFARWVY